MKRIPWNKKTERCPNLMIGEDCPVCGSKYICSESWRKARTNRERVKWHNERAALRKEQT